MADVKGIKVEVGPGVATWPYLVKPDTRYKAEGEFSVGIVLPQEQAAPLIEKIEQIIEEKFQADHKELMQGDGKSKAKAKAMKRCTSLPYKPVVDAETGDETGDVEFKFKLSAQFTDKKTGHFKRRKPALFDAKGHPITKEISIWGGSVIKIGGYLSPFHTAALGVGCSLKLSAVQVIKLVSGGAGGFSFAPVEDEDAFDIETAPETVVAAEEVPVADDGDDAL